MSAEESKMIVRRFLEAIGEGNLDAAVQYLAPDYTMRVPSLPEPVRGAEGFIEVFSEFGRAFEMKPIFEELIAEGDKVAARIRFNIKHIGEYKGMPPTGKEFLLAENDIFRLSNGKIVDHIEEYDVLGFTQALGLVPSEEESVR